MHEVRYLTFSGRCGQKRVYAECNRVHRQRCEYHSTLDNLHFFDKVHESREKAEEFIKTKDDGWYYQAATKYRQNGKTYWLAKIEYHV